MSPRRREVARVATVVSRSHGMPPVQGIRNHIRINKTLCARILTASKHLCNLAIEIDTCRPTRSPRKTVRMCVSTVDDDFRGSTTLIGIVGPDQRMGLWVTPSQRASKQYGLEKPPRQVLTIRREIQGLMISGNQHLRIRLFQSRWLLEVLGLVIAQVPRPMPRCSVTKQVILRMEHPDSLQTVSVHYKIQG
jgi:hypothetical protein